MFPAHARLPGLIVSFCINKYKAYLILLVANLNHRTVSTMSSGEFTHLRPWCQKYLEITTTSNWSNSSNKMSRLRLKISLIWEWCQEVTGCSIQVKKLINFYELRMSCAISRMCLNNTYFAVTVSSRAKTLTDFCSSKLIEKCYDNMPE